MAEQKVIIVGAGLAGLYAALTLSEAGRPCILVSNQPSERAQSVLAAGGINAALDLAGEDDSPAEHARDTMKAGGYIADPAAVKGLTENAPNIIRNLERLGVPFNREDGTISQRYFGGQKKRRTTYARSSTGKVVMTALIDALRRYEHTGLVTRMPHHQLLSLIIQGETCLGVRTADCFTCQPADLFGTVILAFGGMNGMFPGFTTGTTANGGDGAAAVFAQGVKMSGLEMIQYHPTTFSIAGKRCLVSEAARGEGGSLFTMRGNQRFYFMRQRYPELGDLMPRDVVSREIHQVTHDSSCGGQVFLDMTMLSQGVWDNRLSDLRSEIMHYLAIDPKTQPVPVEPGIHYFMGGIDVDVRHRTSVSGLYAAGECCSQYHGANRLGGNSMLGALYGGQVAAEDILSQAAPLARQVALSNQPCPEEASSQFIIDLRDILLQAMGILRTGAGLESGLSALAELSPANRREENRLLLARAMVQSALLRQESRGAHFRSDYPEKDEAFHGRMTAQLQRGGNPCSAGKSRVNPSRKPSRCASYAAKTPAAHPGGRASHSPVSPTTTPQPAPLIR